MATYGIVVGIPQLTLTLLTNIEMTTKSNCVREFCSAMHTMHDVTSLQAILTELAGADGVRTLKDDAKTCTQSA